MSAGGVRIEGLNRLVKSLQELGLDLDDLKDVMAEIAAEGAQRAAAHAPRKSGALANTIRGNRAKNKAVVTAGRGKVKYAAVQNYGWPKRSIKGTEFLQKADYDLRDIAPAMLAEGIQRLIDSKGL